jgi:hypothetical protein
MSCFRCRAIVVVYMEKYCAGRRRDVLYVIGSTF